MYQNVVWLEVNGQEILEIGNCNTVQFMRDIKIIKGTFQGIDDE